MGSQYRLRIYGLPRTEDEDFDRLEDAVAKAKEVLATRTRPAFAEIREMRASRVMWCGFLEEDGSISEMPA